MPMKVAVFNNKGGVRKTTLSIILTQIAIMRGRKVLAVDQDTQNNLNVSLSYMKKDKLFQNFFALDTVLKKGYMDNPPYDLVIMDCASSFTSETTTAIQAADIILIPVRPDSYSLLPLGEIRTKAGDYKDLFQFPLVKVGFDSAQASQKANEKIACRNYTVIGYLPLHPQIPANISSDEIPFDQSSGKNKWWDTGLPTSIRQPFEMLFTRLERLYTKLQAVQKEKAQNKFTEFTEIGGYYDNPENAYIRLWGRKAKSS